MLKKFDETGFNTIDATGKAVLPGFIDSHTHFVFGGYRAEEFSWRLRGEDYMEIMNRGRRNRFNSQGYTECFQGRSDRVRQETP